MPALNPTPIASTYLGKTYYSPRYWGLYAFSTQLAAIRAQPPTSKVYLAILAPQVNRLWLGVVTSYTKTEGVCQIVVTTTSGTLPSTTYGQTLWAGTAADDYSLGRARVRSTSGGNTINLNETDEIPFIAGTVVGIYQEYLPWIKLPFIKSDATLYKDNDIAFLATPNQQTFLWPPVAMMGSAAVGVIINGTAYVYFDGTESYANAPGASIKSYAWVIYKPDGTVFTTSAVVTPGYIAFTTQGFYVAALTVTDTNNITSLTQRSILIVDPANPLYPYYAYTAFEVSKFEGDNDLGWSANFKVRGVSTKAYFPSGAQVLLYSDDSYGGTKNQNYGSQGPKHGNTFTDDATVGTIAWVNPSNAMTLDGVYATVALTAVTYSHYLFASNFGFSIPSTATILGVVASAIHHSTSDTQSFDNTVKLFVGGVASGTNQATVTILPLVDTLRQWGGATNLWGLALTAAQVNATNFGVGLSYGTGLASTVSVDYITLTVYYYDDTGIGFESHRANVKYNGYILNDAVTVDPQTSVAEFETGGVAQVLARQYQRPTFVQDKPLLYPNLLWGLSSYYKLEEASGNRLDSNTLNANDLTPNGTPLPGNTTGKIGFAVSLVAANSQYLSHVDTLSLRHRGEPFTILAWAKLTDKLATYAVVSKWAAGAQHEYIIYYDQPSDRFVFASSTNGTVVVLATANTFGSPTAGVFYFITGRYDGANIYISVNNGAEDSAACVITFTGGTLEFDIGRHGGGIQYFNGVIDEVGFYQRSLTAAERTAYYNSGVGRSYPFGSSAATWSEADSLTVRRAILYLLYWHSTLMEVADVLIENDTTPQAIADFPKNNLWDMLRNWVSSKRLMHPYVTKNGRVSVLRDPQINTLAERNALAQVFQLFASDWQGEVQVQENVLKNVSYLDASGMWYEGNAGTTTTPVYPIPIFSKAPGTTPSVYGRDMAQQYLALTGQIIANTLSGELFNWRNNNYPQVIIKFAGNWVSAMDTGYAEYVQAPAVGFPAQRGALLAALRMIARRMSIALDNAHGVWTVDATFEVESPSTPSGITGDYPPSVNAFQPNACPMGYQWSPTTRSCGLIGTGTNQFPWANTFRDNIVVAVNRGVWGCDNFSFNTPVWFPMNVGLYSGNTLALNYAMKQDPYNPSILYLLGTFSGAPPTILFKFNPTTQMWSQLGTARDIAIAAGLSSAGVLLNNVDIRGLMTDPKQPPNWVGLFITNAQNPNYATYFTASSDGGATWSAASLVAGSGGVGWTHDTQYYGVCGSIEKQVGQGGTQTIYCPLMTHTNLDDSGTLYYSTNGGRTWNASAFTSPTYEFFYGKFFIDPSDQSVMWYSRRFDGVNAGGLWQFTGTAGAVASKLANVGSWIDFGGVDVHYNPSGHGQDIRLFDQNTNIDALHKKKMYHSANEGGAFTTQNGVGLFDNGFPYGVMTLPDSNGMLIAFVWGATNDSAGHSIYVSTDEGATWTGKNGKNPWTPDATSLPYNAVPIIAVCPLWNAL